MVTRCVPRTGLGERSIKALLARERWRHTVLALQSIKIGAQRFTTLRQQQGLLL